MTKLQFTISGMNCEHCVESLRDALAAVSGVSQSAVELGSASVTFDESTCSRASVIAAIRNAGAFDVTGFSTSV